MRKYSFIFVSFIILVVIFSGCEIVKKEKATFVLQTKFLLTVPVLYNHETSLTTLDNQINRNNIYLDDDITDEHFSKVTDKLIPDKTYTVKIFQISRNNVSSEECLTFLKSQNALLVGAQGLTLAWRLGNEKFPKEKWLVSFDQEAALWKDDVIFGSRRVPYVFCIMDHYWYFHLGYFNFYWRSGHCLLCICD